MTPKKKEHVARHMLLLLRSSFVLPQLLTLNLFIAGTLFQGELVKVFLASLYYDAGSQFFGAVALGYVVYLDIIHSDAALLYIASGVGL